MYKKVNNNNNNNNNNEILPFSYKVYAETTR